MKERWGTLMFPGYHKRLEVDFKTLSRAESRPLAEIYPVRLTRGGIDPIHLTFPTVSVSPWQFPNFSFGFSPLRSIYPQSLGWTETSNSSRQYSTRCLVTPLPIAVEPIASGKVALPLISLHLLHNFLIFHRSHNLPCYFSMFFFSTLLCQHHRVDIN